LDAKESGLLATAVWLLAAGIVGGLLALVRP
jgi:hypothetical protein